MLKRGRGTSGGKFYEHVTVFEGWKANTQRSGSNGKGQKTSQYRGVQVLPNGRFRANISRQGVPIQIGIFDDEHEAAAARDDAALAEYGDAAVLNFERESLC